MDPETGAGSLKKRKRRHLAVVPAGEKNVRGQTVAHASPYHTGRQEVKINP